MGFKGELTRRTPKIQETTQERMRGRVKREREREC
jgi:hypothetical protein